jgi:hypothetical protein
MERKNVKEIQQYVNQKQGIKVNILKYDSMICALLENKS